MYDKVLNFIKYHNAFTILFIVAFFGFGISYAASPAVRDSVYSSEERVVSIDNGLIISTDLDNFNFNLRINSVTEDEKNYYAAYSYQTLVIEDDVWQIKEIEKTLKVSREALDGKDFGLYAAKQLGENIRYELSYLKRVQKLEKEKGESQKVVAVAYSGLIGKLFNPKERIMVGYKPVIREVPRQAATIVHPPSRPSLPAAIETPTQSPPYQGGEEEGVSSSAAVTSTPTTSDQATSTPAVEPVAPAPEVSQEPTTENTSTSTPPQVQATSTPALETIATSTSEVAPVIEATSTSEVVPSQ